MAGTKDRDEVSVRKLCVSPARDPVAQSQAGFYLPSEIHGRACELLSATVCEWL